MNLEYVNYMTKRTKAVTVYLPNIYKTNRSCTYLIFEEHAMILNCTAKVVDVIATLFVAGYCSTGLAAVTALTGFALLNAVHDIHQCTVQRLVDAVRPQGTVEVDPDADVHVEETGRSVRVTVSDSTAQNTNSLVLQGASWL